MVTREGVGQIRKWPAPGGAGRISERALRIPGRSGIGKARTQCNGAGLMPTFHVPNPNGTLHYAPRSTARLPERRGRKRISQAARVPTAPAGEQSGMTTFALVRKQEE